MAWFGRMSGLLGGELTQTGLLKQTKRNTWKEKKKRLKKKSLQATLPVSGKIKVLSKMHLSS